jgi:hypothetical protein
MPSEISLRLARAGNPGITVNLNNEGTKTRG